VPLGVRVIAALSREDLALRVAAAAEALGVPVSSPPIADQDIVEC
jgi:hypothetical protein